MVLPLPHPCDLSMHCWSRMISLADSLARTQAHLLLVILTYWRVMTVCASSCISFLPPEKAACAENEERMGD